MIGRWTTLGAVLQDGRNSWATWSMNWKCDWHSSQLLASDAASNSSKKYICLYMFWTQTGKVTTVTIGSEHCRLVSLWESCNTVTDYCSNSIISYHHLQSCQPSDTACATLASEGIAILSNAGTRSMRLLRRALISAACFSASAFSISYVFWYAKVPALPFCTPFLVMPIYTRGNSSVNAVALPQP